MQLFNDLNFILWAVGGLFLGLTLGVAISQLLGRGQRTKTESDLAELHRIRLELTTANGVLEQRLEGQKDQYEAQLKLLQDARKTLSSEFENLANRIFEDKQSKFSVQNKEALEVTLSPLRRDIGDFRKQVESAYDKENAERNKLVGQLGELQKQTMQISEDAVSLANALRGDNKAQGNWGEFVLEKLLEDSGLTKGREYDTQVAHKDESGRRRNPDVIIHLPEGRDIVIDAKVSLVDYERYFHAEDDETKQQCLRQHLNSLRAHIKGLSHKQYEDLDGVNSLDFVLIFVPVEAAFMLALDQDPEMIRDAYDRGIILASPNTLMVTLRTIKNLWRYEDQSRNAQLIADKAGGLYDHFVRFVESLNEVGKHISKSQEAWETAHKRLAAGKGNLVRRTEELKKLGAKAKKSLADTAGLPNASLEDNSPEDNSKTDD